MTYGTYSGKTLFQASLKATRQQKPLKNIVEKLKCKALVEIYILKKSKMTSEVQSEPTHPYQNKTSEHFERKPNWFL